MPQAVIKIARAQRWNMIWEQLRGLAQQQLAGRVALAAEERREREDRFVDYGLAGARSRGHARLGDTQRRELVNRDVYAAMEAAERARLHAAFMLQFVEGDALRGWAQISRDQEVERANHVDRERKLRHVLHIVEHSKYGTPIPLAFRATPDGGAPPALQPEWPEDVPDPSLSPAASSISSAPSPYPAEHRDSRELSRSWSAGRAGRGIRPLSEDVPADTSSVGSGLPPTPTMGPRSRGASAHRRGLSAGPGTGPRPGSSAGSRPSSGALRPTSSGAMRPGSGAIRPAGFGAMRPGSGAVRPTSTGGLRPSPAAMRPMGVDARRPSSSGAIRPQQAPALRPTSSGQRRRPSSSSGTPSGSRQDSGLPPLPSPSAAAAANARDFPFAPLPLATAPGPDAAAAPEAAYSKMPSTALLLSAAALSPAALDLGGRGGPSSSLPPLTLTAAVASAPKSSPLKAAEPVKKAPAGSSAMQPDAADTLAPEALRLQQEAGRFASWASQVRSLSKPRLWRPSAYTRTLGEQHENRCTPHTTHHTTHTTHHTPHTTQHTPHTTHHTPHTTHHTTHTTHHTPHTTHHTPHITHHTPHTTHHTSHTTHNTSHNTPEPHRVRSPAYNQVRKTGSISRQTYCTSDGSTPTPPLTCPRMGLRPTANVSQPSAIQM